MASRVTAYGTPDVAGGRRALVVISSGSTGCSIVRLNVRLVRVPASSVTNTVTDSEPDAVGVPKRMQVEPLAESESQAGNAAVSANQE